MSQESSLGSCPNCGERIPPAYHLISYERADGTRGVYAECPACETVVSPERR